MKRPAHQIIYTHGGGRLGNQVIRAAHWIAWVRSQTASVEVVNLAFWPFASLFEVWGEHPGCVFPLRPGGADRWARRFDALPAGLQSVFENRRRGPCAVQSAGRLLPGWQAIDLNIAQGEALDLDSPAFLGRVTRRPVTTIAGWRIATWKQVAAQEIELRSYFRPAAAFRRAAESFVTGLRDRYDRLFGVFIRQTDYREWYDGRFLFETGRYADWMRELVELNRGQRVGFVVASESAQDAAVFSGLPVHFATGVAGQGGHWFESWIELSLCDVIVSPPSTFSATAAFLGDRPLWPVLARDQTMAFDQVMMDGMVGAARHPIFSLAVK
jgi:hypothetical protein